MSLESLLPGALLFFICFIAISTSLTVMLGRNLCIVNWLYTWFLPFHFLRVVRVLVELCTHIWNFFFVCGYINVSILLSRVANSGFLANFVICLGPLPLGGYSTLSWVRMCGPKFRPPPYNKTREDANLLPISKPFVSWRALFKTNQCFLQCKLGCISTFWQPIDKPQDKFIRNYAFCKNATYI